MQASLAVLVGSHGRGSNMAAIHAACQSGQIAARVKVVFSTNQDSPALAYARELEIATAAGSAEHAHFGAKVANLLKIHQIDLVCLAGYMRLVPLEVLEAFPNKIVNIHPALLPKFGGKGMYGIRVHEAVLESGDTESGCTVHYVNERYDEGEIILQRRCAVLPSDTPDSLAARVLGLEHIAYPEAIAQVLSAR